MVGRVESESETGTSDQQSPEMSIGNLKSFVKSSLRRRRFDEKGNYLDEPVTDESKLSFGYFSRVTQPQFVEWARELYVYLTATSEQRHIIDRKIASISTKIKFAEPTEKTQK